MLGEQIIKGMAVTAKNFFGSYVSKERLTTVQYPEEHLVPKENTRQFPFLVYDGDDWEKGVRCVACQICEKERLTTVQYPEEHLVPKENTRQFPFLVYDGTRCSSGYW